MGERQRDAIAQAARLEGAPVEDQRNLQDVAVLGVKEFAELLERRRALLGREPEQPEQPEEPVEEDRKSVV